MACEINIKESGNVSVKTYPKLFNELLAYNEGNLNLSIEMYGMTMTEQFSNIFGNTKPSLDEFLSFINQDNIIKAGAISPEDRNTILGLSLQQSVEENIKERFIQSFTVNGTFGINRYVLNSTNLFTTSEIDDIMEGTDVEKLRTMYQRLLNSEEEFKGQGYDLVEFGEAVGERLNPDATIQRMYDNYIGVDDIGEKAEELQDEFVMNNPQYIPIIEDLVGGKQKLVAYETDEYGGEIVTKKRGDIIPVLEQTLDLNQNFTPVLEQLSFLKEMSAYSWINDFDMVMQYVYNLEKQFAALGIDFDALSDIVPNRKPEDIQEFLDITYNFIYDLSTGNIESIQENIKDFGTTYNQFLNRESENITKISDEINRNGVYLHLETNRTEEDLFKNNSIIKFSKNVYRKINDNKTLSQLYEDIIRGNFLPKSIYKASIDEMNMDILKNELDSYISTQLSEYDVEEVENVKKLLAYKILLGLNNKVVENPGFKKVENFSPENFIVAMNKEILSNINLKDIFYISNRGLEAKIPIGEYTKQYLKNILPEKMYTDLESYAWLSQNESLESLVEENLDQPTTEDELRDFYINNPTSLPTLKNNFTQVGDNTISINNMTEPFVRIGNNIYEYVRNGLYEKLPIKGRYLSLNNTKPEITAENIAEDIEQTIDTDVVIENKKVDSNEIEFC